MNDKQFFCAFGLTLLTIVGLTLFASMVPSDMPVAGFGLKLGFNGVVASYSANFGLFG